MFHLLQLILDLLKTKQTQPNKNKQQTQTTPKHYKKANLVQHS